MPRLKVGGVELQYELGGRGPRLLVISGTGADLRSVPSIFDSPLAADFTLLAYDQRGLGRSDIPPGPYGMGDYADDAAGLLRAVGWTKCHVLGISFGGMVAQELALRDGELVDHLVLACTSSGGAGGSSYPLHELVALPIGERVERALELADVRCDAAWRKVHEAEFDELVRVRTERERNSFGDSDRERGSLLQLEARSHHDTFDRLEAIDIPTFVCGGRYDGIAPIENLERLAQAIPRATCQFFEGGHGFLREDPAVIKAIVAFLS